MKGALKGKWEMPGPDVGRSVFRAICKAEAEQVRAQQKQPQIKHLQKR